VFQPRDRALGQGGPAAFALNPDVEQLKSMLVFKACANRANCSKANRFGFPLRHHRTSHQALISALFQKKIGGM
jgi:hypothetical protein